jgi:Bacteriophage baseplate protein W
MDAGRLFGRGIAFPPRVENGRVAWSAGEENIREAIRIVLLTDQRERIRLPEFGGTLRRFLFEPNTVVTRHRIEEQINVALSRWEDRIAVDTIAVEPDADDPQAAIATITYRLVATQTVERVSLTVMLAPSPGSGQARSTGSGQAG